MIFSGLIDELKTMLRRKRRNILLLLSAGLFLLTAYVSGIVAAGIWLTGIYGLQAAPIILAIVALATCVAILAVLKIIEWRERKHKKASIPIQTVLTPALLTLSSHLIRKNKTVMFGLAAIAGLALAGGVQRSGEEDS